MTRHRPWWPWLLGLIALASRLIYTSTPYYVDGPRHLAGVSSGDIFIQPPGYYLYGESARLLSLLMHGNAWLALTAINIGFSALGAVVFAKLTLRLFDGQLGVLLGVFYAFSVIVWFDADIQSTYAAMTFFVPALLYTVWVMENWWLAGIVWAAMTGFRPSDGVFVTPFIAYTLWRSGTVGTVLRRSAVFAAAALPVILLWYVPTVRHFNGALLSPLLASGSQAATLARGLLTHYPLKDKVGTLVRIAFACFDAWNVLLVFLIAGVLVNFPRRVSVLIWMLPGMLFYMLYFFSDAVYVSYLIAPGLLLAGEALRRMRPRPALAVVSAAIVLALVQMTVLRPVDGTSMARAVVDSYYLEYSGWGIRHQYFRRLRDTLSNMPTATEH